MEKLTKKQEEVLTVIKKYIAEQEQLLQAQMEIDLERQRNKIAKQREIIAKRKAREEAKKLKNATRRTK